MYAHEGMDFRFGIGCGDLILQRKGRGLFGTTWSNYRNLDEELRLLNEHAEAARKRAAELTRLFHIAKKNIEDIKQPLQCAQMDNSHAQMYVPLEPSILEEKPGVKYNTGEKKDGNNNGNNNNNSDNNNGNNNGNNNSNGKHGNKPKEQPLLALLANARVTMH